MPPTEDQEQMQFIQWLEARDYKFTAIPNSTYTRSWKQKRHNTDMGLRAGFPDLVVIAKDVFMCIEMKRTKGSVISPSQKEWVRSLKQANVPVAVCNGAVEAIAFVESIVGR